MFIDRITALANKVTKARELLLNDGLDAGNFRAVKTEAERKMQVLESKIADLHTPQLSAKELTALLEKGVTNLCDFEQIYCKSDLMANARS